MSVVPDLVWSYCVLHVVDILDALPTTANPTARLMSPDLAVPEILWL